MAEKLSIQIALEGGAEIEKQLAGIGEAGQKAFADITTSAEQAGGFKEIKPEEVTQKLKDMGVTGVDAIEKIQSAVKQAGRLEGIVQGVQAVETGFARIGQAALALAPVIAGIAVAGGAAFVTAAKSTISFAESISKVNAEALKLGTGIEKFDQLRLGLEKAGISAKGISSGLENFQRVFGSLDGLPQFIEQLRQMPPSAERSALAIKAFGQAAGTELIQALRTGSIGVDQFAQKQQGLTQEQANAASKLEQSINRMKAAWDRLGSLALSQTVTDSINIATNAVEKLGGALDALKGVGTSEFGKSFGETVTQAVGIANNAIAQFVGGVMRGMGASEAAIKAVQDQINGVVPAANAAGQAVQQSSQMFTQWGTTAQQAGQEAADGQANAGQAAQQAGTMFTQWGTAATQAGTAAAQAGQQGATAGQTAAQGAQQATSAWDVLLAKLREFLGLASQAGAPAAANGGGSGMASGGLLGGRGSGTSDSNLAWVSRGEYITPARAVAQPGVLAFLEALRRSGGNLGRVLDGMSRFALGGLVRGPMPAFATGGLSGGMSNVTIQFPGLPAIGGLRASADVVDQLHRAAALAQVRSGGRKPSRYS